MRTSLLPVSKWAENPSRSITAVTQYRTSDGSRDIWFISINLARDGARPWHPKASPLGRIVAISLIGAIRDTCSGRVTRDSERAGILACRGLLPTNALGVRLRAVNLMKPALQS